MEPRVRSVLVPRHGERVRTGHVGWQLQATTDNEEEYEGDGCCALAARLMAAMDEVIGRGNLGDMRCVNDHEYLHFGANEHGKEEEDEAVGSGERDSHVLLLSAGHIQY